MDSRTRQRVEGSARLGSIPLRPELVEFLSVRCLSRYSRCSKAVRADVREANAWQLLAARQAPLATPRTARDALEIDAISRVRSHVRRRLLADALADTSSTHGLCANRVRDFTFFVRISKGGRMLWEGDVRHHWSTDVGVRLSLTEAWATIRLSGLCKELKDWLAETNTDWEHDEAVLEPFAITLVAIRDVDQAMVSLGHFSFHEHANGTGEPDQAFLFLDSPRDRHLFAVPGFKFKAHLYLGTQHRDDPLVGHLEYLDLEVHRYETHEGEDSREGEIRSYPFRYLLTFLAGCQPFERAEAIRTMEESL